MKYLTSPTVLLVAFGILVLIIAYIRYLG